MTRRPPTRLLATVFVAATVAVVASLSIDAVARSVALEQCPKFAAVPFGERWLDPCYAAAVDRMLDEQGPAATAARFDRRLPQDRELRSICHEMMHLKGRPVGKQLTTSREVSKVTGAFPLETGSCAAGMLHGMFEGYIERHGFAAGDQSAFLIMCGTGRQVAVRKRRFDCAHGLGHAATLHFEGLVEPATAFCRGMPQPEGDDCASGVLMSQVEGARFEGGPMTKLQSAKQLTAFCDAFDAEQRFVCYRWIPLTTAFNRSKLTNEDVLSACDRAPKRSDERLACYIGIGRQAPAGRSQCGPLPGVSDRAGCAYGLAVGRVINTTLEPVAKVSVNCSELREASAQESCYLGVGRVWPLLREGAKGGQAEDVCAKLRSRGAKAACLRGAQMWWQPFDYSRMEQAAIREIVDNA